MGPGEIEELKEVKLIREIELRESKLKETMLELERYAPGKDIRRPSYQAKDLAPETLRLENKRLWLENEELKMEIRDLRRRLGIINARCR